MMGVENESIHVSGAGWSPVSVLDNLEVMSIGFMLPSKDDAVIWRGPKKNGLIKQFLKDVEWGNDVDIMLVDTPPGTSDEHLSVNALLKESGIDGAVLVTTPQEVSLLDVRREIDFCRRANIKIIGLAENMAGYVCKCKHINMIFKPTTGGGKGLAEEMGIPFLGSVPLDPRIRMACDYGESYFDSFPDSPACVAFMNVVRNVAKEIGLDIEHTDPD